MDKIKFAVIGDCHYSEKGNYSTRDCLGAKNKLQEIIDNLNGQELDFVLSLGDIGNGDNVSEVSQMLEVYSDSANPVKFVIGNHDLVQHSDEEFAHLVGMPSPFYSFDIKNYRFIVLNAFEHKGKGCPENSDAKKIASVASPIYFRNADFIPPKVLKLKKTIPSKILERCEELTYEDLAHPELIEEFRKLLIEMDVAE